MFVNDYFNRQYDRTAVKTRLIFDEFLQCASREGDRLLKDYYINRGPSYFDRIKLQIKIYIK